MYVISVIVKTSVWVPNEIWRSEELIFVHTFHHRGGFIDEVFPAGSKSGSFYQTAWLL